ncbi:MAG: hypothetical protein ABIC68_02825 [Candidatus Omnitrophota bacterium]
MAALFGLLGVFAVFKLQLTRERLKSTVEHVVRTIQSVDGLGSEVVLWERDEICSHLRKELALIEDLPISEITPIRNLKKVRYADFLKVFKVYGDEEKNIKKSLRASFLCIMIVFIFSLIFLFINPFVSGSIKVFCGSFIIVFVLLALTFLNIKRCILFSIDFEKQEL